MSKAKAETKSLPKRFYAAVSVLQHNDGFCIALDGKKIKTPQQKLLHTKSKKLAQQIAAEWEAQTEVINADAMPLTRLLNIALDRVPETRAELLTDIANYCDTDLLFYRAPLNAELDLTSRTGGKPSPLAGEGLDGGAGSSAAPYPHAPSPLPRVKPGVDPLPQGERVPPASPLADNLSTEKSVNEELFLLQQKHFTPILDWCSKKYGIAFTLTEGVMPVSQPKQTLETLTEIFADADDHELAALAMMVPLLGSALLALAVWKGSISVEEALTAARLDETVQAEHWGEDAEVAEKWNAKARDIRASAFFLTQK